MQHLMQDLARLVSFLQDGYYWKNANDNLLLLLYEIRIHKFDP